MTNLFGFFDRASKTKELIILALESAIIKDPSLLNMPAYSTNNQDYFLRIEI